MLKVGQVIYHRHYGTSGTIKSIMDNKLLIEWSNPITIKGNETMEMFKNSLGVFLVFSENDVGVQPDDLRMRKEYAPYGDKGQLEEYFELSHEKEREDVRSIINLLISVVRDIIDNASSMQLVNNKFGEHRSGCIDYDHPGEQYLYLVRYFYAYYYEYSELLTKVCSDRAFGRVVSIGCGSCLDALALKHLTYRSFANFEYLGIDPTDWHCRKFIFEKLLPNARFEEKKLSAHSIDLIEDATILFFPKSLTPTDIDEDSMQMIIECIEHTNFKSNEIMVVSSFVPSSDKEEDTNIAVQLKRHNSIVESLGKKGFGEVASDKIIRSEMEKKSLIRHNNKILNPKVLKDFFNKEMSQRCTKYQQNGKKHCGVCRANDYSPTGERLHIQPKLSNAPVYNVITYLERRGGQNDIKC